MENVTDTWRPSRAAALVPALAAALFSVYATSVPGWDFSWVTTVFLAWAIIGLVWLGTLVRLLFKGGLRREWPVWAVPPLIVLLACGLVYTGAPLQARFIVSRPALDAFAEDVSRGAPLPGDDEWIGLFPIHRAEKFPGGVLFAVDDAGFLGATGFAYSPDGEPPQVSGEEMYDHLRGPWYLWQENF